MHEIVVLYLMLPQSSTLGNVTPLEISLGYVI